MVETFRRNVSTTVRFGDVANSAVLVVKKRRSMLRLEQVTCYVWKRLLNFNQQVAAIALAIHLVKPSPHHSHLRQPQRFLLQ